MQMWNDAVSLSHLKVNKMFLLFYIGIPYIFTRIKFTVREGESIFRIGFTDGPHGPVTEIAISRQIYSTKQKANFLFVSK